MPARPTDYRHVAASAAERAHVPYSGRHEAVVLVLEDGWWIPGVRVESATFSLTIPALLNAVTTAAALDVSPVRAIVGSRPFRPQELTFARTTRLVAHLSQTAPDVLGDLEGLPHPGEQRPAAFDPALTEDLGGPGISVESPVDVLAAARRVAERAFVPESGFPVGCLLQTGDGDLIPGVNVEHGDWMHILCAERNALGTAVSYGVERIAALYLACLQDAACTPCGACRQLLAELAPASTLWMDRGIDSPASSTPLTLLPGFFTGESISRST